MRILLTAVAGALLALGCASSADAAVRVGTLRCLGAPKVGAIVASVQQTRCIFTGINGRHERYVGQFGRIGADIGVTNRSELVWSVYAPTSLRHRALVGNYVGASADVTVGVGGGANVLVGGSNATVSLQPISVKTETGLAVGAGLGQLQLR
jgi:opacity protein-like surface antigen